MIWDILAQRYGAAGADRYPFYLLVCAVWSRITEYFRRRSVVDNTSLHVGLIFIFETLNGDTDRGLFLAVHHSWHPAVVAFICLDCCMKASKLLFCFIQISRHFPL